MERQFLAGSATLGLAMQALTLTIMGVCQRLFDDAKIPGVPFGLGCVPSSYIYM